MLMRRFNAWFEDRLAVAIGLAADLRAVVDHPRCGGFRDATPEEVAAIGQFLSEHGLTPRSATVVPFHAANDRHPKSPPEPPHPAA
jgi:hypothetical protein